jgi:VCBS repeat-containing protein
MPTKIKGTKGNDILNGDATDNEINGGDGNDQLYGLGGNDVLKGEKGNDKLDGGVGNDRLQGEQGADTLLGGQGMDALYGGDDNDSLNGGSEADLLDGGKGNDVLVGEDGDDILAGNHGNDRLLGGNGDDVLLGDGSLKGSGTGWGKAAKSGSGKDSGSGKSSAADQWSNWATKGSGGSGSGAGNDYLDGGAGNDMLYSGGGNDTGHYQVTENAGAADHYDGGDGIDTLELELTLAEWLDPAFQGDLANYLAFLEAHTSKKTGKADNQAFAFTAFDLSASAWEKLTVTVDGVSTNPADEAALAKNDNFSTNEDTAISGNVLSNNGAGADQIPDYLRAVTLVTAPAGTLALNANGTFSYDPATAYQYLAAGESAVDSLNYRIEDADGDTSTATVSIQVKGLNDAPVIGSADTAGATTEIADNAAGENTAQLTAAGTIAFTDLDLTDAHTVTVTSAGGGAGFRGTLTAAVAAVATGGGAGAVSWSFKVNDGDLDNMAKDQTLVQVYTVLIDDGKGGTASRNVTITITGTNDVPVITAQDLVGGVTELLAPAGNLTDSGAISFSDVDLTDSHLVSATAVGATLGSLTAVKNTDTTGTGTGGQVTWNYTVPASAVEFLAAGQTTVESFIVSIDDQNGGVTTSQVDVTITGTNDMPVITAQDLAGGVTELVTPAGSLTDSGVISFSDVDLTDAHLVSATAVGTTLGSLTASVSNDTTGSGTGGQVTWNYSVPASSVEFLAAGQTRVESFNISLSDQNGGVVSRQINVVIAGTNDAPVITSEDLNGAIKVPVQEVAAPPSPLVFTVQQFLGYQSNDLNTLRNYASSHTANYTVQTNVIDYTDDTGGFAGELPGSSRWPAAVAQGAFGTAGINDVFFARITAEFSVSSADTYTFRTFNDDGVFLLIDNTLIISDTGYHPEVAFNGSIALSPGNHTIELFFFENGGEASLELSARTSSGSFGLVGGTGGGFGGSLSQVTDSGVITFSDVDLTDSHLVSAAGTPVGTTLGSLSAVKNIDTTGTGTGGQLTWNYSAPSSALAYLGEGQTKVESFTITLNDQQGGLITKQIDVTITGTNEGPVVGTQVLSGALVEQITPSGVRTQSGSIQFTDVDLSDTHVASSAPLGSTLGSLTASIGSDTTGTGTGGQLNWQYTVNASAVEYLVANQNKIETFTVTLDDQHGGQVTRQVNITITGTNDAAILGSAVANLVETDVQLTTSGTLSISDVDTGQAHFNAQSNTAGNYGNFSIAANGAWSYATAGALNNLAEGQVVTDVFNVTSVDGTSTSVTVNITGTADGPTATDDSNSLTASSKATSTGNTVYWVDWQSATQLSAPSPGTDGTYRVNGTIGLPGGHNINVTYEGQYFFVQTAAGETFYYTQPSGAVYTSAAVANGPGTSDIIALGDAASARNLTFSEPVENLFFAIVSMNSNGYLFDQDFNIVSRGQGYFGNSSNVTKSATGDGRFGITSSGNPSEFHGVLQIDGAVSSLTWTSQADEYWNGFTVGTYGQAQASTANGNLLGNDIADASNPLLEISAVGGQNMAGNSVTLTLPSGASIKVDRDGDYLYDDKGQFTALGAGDTHTESVVYTVRDDGGNTDTATLTITVNGVNDAAVLGTAVVSLTETDAALSTGGTLSITDVDTGEALFNTQNSTAGTYGSFSIAANGVWSYNTNGALDHLLTGQQVADVFNVTSVDGTATTVKVNITGTALHIAAPGNLAKNGSFENNLTDWATLAGGVDRVHSNLWQSGEGSYSLDLNAFSAGGVQQAVATQNGTSYGVFFQISKNYDGAGTIPSATMKVSAAGSTQNYSFAESNSPTNMMWRGETFGFTANSASTTLSFESLTQSFFSPAKGPALDDVVVLANTIVNGFDKADGDVLDLVNLLASIGAPNNTTAFNNGYLRFQQSGSDTLVQVDANGGADDYLTAVTLIGVSLSQSDTGNYSL